MTLEPMSSRAAAGAATDTPVGEDFDEFVDAFENAPIPLHWVGPDGTILRANRAELEYLGYTPDEYIGRNIRDVFADAGVIADILERLGRGETLHDYEARMIARDGSIRDVVIDSSALFRDGRFVHSRCFTRDNTARKRAERALRRGEERFRSMIETANEGVLIIDRDAMVTYANERFAAMLGYARDELPGMSLFDLMDEDMRAESERRIARRREGRAEQFDFRFRHRDGRAVWTIVAATPLLAASGAYAGSLSMITDITLRREAEEALRRSESRLASMFNQATVGVAQALPDGRFAIVNERYCEIVGRAREELLAGLRVQDITHPEDLPGNLRLVERLLHDGTPFQIESRYVRPDGSVVWVNNSVAPTRAPDGSIEYVSAVVVDVTDRKRTEEALREERETVETLHDIGARLASDLDLRSVVQTVTDAATKLTGAAFGAFYYHGEDERGEAVTLHALSGTDVDAFTGFPMPRGGEVAGPASRGEGIVRIDDVTADPRYADGSPHPGAPAGQLLVRSYLAAPVVSRAGQVLGVLVFGHPRPAVFGERAERLVRGIAAWAAIAIDNARLFEERERVERSLREALHAKDEFLGMVSHELKTPITTIFGNAEVLRRRGDRLDDVSRREALEDMSREADRLHRIIDNLLVLARLEQGRAIDAEPILVRRLVARVVAEHRRRDPAREFVFREDESPIPVAADPLYIEQVTHNLLSNATKYSPPGTPIEVSVRHVGDELVVRVLDRGPGIAEEDAERVFTPFYRSPLTAQQIGGVGIGLAVCKRLVEAQGGRMWAAPREGGGADIGFALPVVEDALRPDG